MGRQFLSFGILVICLILLYRKTFHHSTPCNADPTIILLNGDKNEISLDDCHVYSTEYYEARDKFRQAANLLIGTNNDTTLHSLSIIDDLTIDIVIIRGKKPGTVFHSSGLHGVEGYAGSAIQIGFLNILLQAETQGGSSTNKLLTTTNRPTIVLIHAINPYGMKNFRRVNENNVDLNRNAISNFGRFLKRRNPNIGKYDDFRDFVSPDRVPTGKFVSFYIYNLFFHSSF